MAKRLMFLPALLAAMLSVAAPVAVAQEATEQQYDPQAQPLVETEEFAGFGVVEYTGDKADGSPVYGLAVSPETGYYMEGDFDFSTFEGQNVYATGQLVFDGNRVLQVEQIEPVSEEAAVEEISVTGVEDAATGEVYPTTGGPGSDLSPYPNEQATVYGTIEEADNGFGRALDVSRVEAASGETKVTEETTNLGRAMTVETAALEEQFEDGDTVYEADGELVQTSEGGVTFTSAGSALPVTGGMVLPAAGIFGTLLLVGGALYRQKLGS